MLVVALSHMHRVLCSLYTVLIGSATIFISSIVKTVMSPPGGMKDDKKAVDYVKVRYEGGEAKQDLSKAKVIREPKKLEHQYEKYVCLQFGDESLVVV